MVQYNFRFPRVRVGESCWCRRDAALARTFGCLSQEDADAMLKAIEEGCEQIDEQGW